MSDIRIIVADDHPMFRRGVVDSLNAIEGFEVIGEAATGEEAARLATDALPDVLLMDIDMPGQGGIEAAAEITTSNPATRILMLTVSENEDDLLGALKAGARGYVLKGIGVHGLVRAVSAIMAGEVYISSALAGTVLYEMTHTAVVDPMSELTEREYQVLQLVGEGLTNREIGDRLYLAEKTIKHYMTGVFRKLQVRSRVEAALLAHHQEGRRPGEEPDPT